ncbi:MAG TPA: hypothetical protein VFL80_08825, partial [Thermoanaerobaculia bacterium]|nr:hypothetical protein [Thermoanaerobaculia bacterium]
MWRASVIAFVLALLGGRAYAPYFVLRDDFDRFDSNRWVVAKWRAPGDSHLNGSHFLASNAWIENGCLVLKLLQTEDPGGMGRVRSYGAEVATRERYGFGTYEWRARVGSTASTPLARGEQVSGGVTGLFNYEAPAGALRTEIDIEVEG